MAMTRMVGINLNIGAFVYGIVESKRVMEGVRMGQGYLLSAMELGRDGGSIAVR